MSKWMTRLCLFTAVFCFVFAVIDVANNNLYWIMCLVLGCFWLGFAKFWSSEGA